MEGSESEKVFASLNLEPKLFINEVMNAVGDIIDEGFAFYEQQALELLGDMDKDGVDELSKCVSSIRNMIQEIMDKRLAMWETYCLGHCFVVPEGFSLPKADTAGDTPFNHEADCDAELDNQLDLLREKLSMVGKESAELQKEFHAMRKLSVLSSTCTKSVTDALQQYEQNSVHDMFQEMVKTASKLQDKLENLKNKRKVELELVRTERIYDQKEDWILTHHSNGIPQVDLKHIPEFLSSLKNI